MKKNPLTSTIITFAIGDAYTLWEAVTRGSVSVFTVIAWLQGIVLFGLYLRKSRYAGSYLFYSVIPLFPVYFGLKFLGFNPPPPSSAVYIICFLVYVAGVILLWKQKRDYDHYIRVEAISPSTVS